VRALLAPIAVASLAACGDITWLQADVERTCHQLLGQRLEISPQLRGHVQETWGDAVELSRAFSIDLREGLPKELRETAEAQLALTSLEVVASGPTAHLGFVDAARVSLQPATPGALAPWEYVYVREEAEPRSIGWSREPVDLAAWIGAGPLRFAVAFVGRVPEADAVVVDVTLCTEASLALQLP
jgi:hypothetical protein